MATDDKVNAVFVPNLGRTVHGPELIRELDVLDVSLTTAKGAYVRHAAVRECNDDVDTVRPLWVAQQLAQLEPNLAHRAVAEVARPGGDGGDPVSERVSASRERAATHCKHAASSQHSLLDQADQADLDTTPLLDDEAVQRRGRAPGAVVDDVTEQPRELGRADELGHVRVAKVEVVVADARRVDLDRVQDGDLGLVTASY